jgi:hypothetical protein
MAQKVPQNGITDELNSFYDPREMLEKKFPS